LNSTGVSRVSPVIAVCRNLSPLAVVPSCNDSATACNVLAGHHFHKSFFKTSVAAAAAAAAAATRGPAVVLDVSRAGRPALSRHQQCSASSCSLEVFPDLVPEVFFLAFTALEQDNTV